jgi:hypothetical protein
LQYFYNKLHSLKDGRESTMSVVFRSLIYFLLAGIGHPLALIALSVQYQKAFRVVVDKSPHAVSPAVDDNPCLQSCVLQIAEQVIIKPSLQLQPYRKIEQRISRGPIH